MWNPRKILLTKLAGCSHGKILCWRLRPPCKDCSSERPSVKEDWSLLQRRIRDILQLYLMSLNWHRRPPLLNRLDDLIADWIQEKFTSGEPLNTIADCLSGLHHFIPMTRKSLPVCWRLFGIWRRHEIPSRAPPITADLILGMSSYHMQCGNFTFGVLILLAFHCFLRTGEIFQLTTGDFWLGLLLE